MRVLSQAFVLFAAAGLCLECFGQRTISEVDPAKRGWYGEFYDLREYERCVRKTNNPRNRQCDYLRLTRVEEPAYWPYPDVPKPKLPEAPNPPVYRKGMTSKQYFDALCKAEAGEFIYKVVENVEGVYQIRPRKVASWEALMDRYVMEDPYGYEQWEATKPETMFALPGRYKSFEKPLEERASERKAKLTIKYFQGEPDRQARYPIESIGNSVRSKHGFYWRGIVRPMDRELAIAGGGTHCR